jgi:hypothetical protein
MIKRPGENVKPLPPATMGFERTGASFNTQMDEIFLPLTEKEMQFEGSFPSTFIPIRVRNWRGKKRSGSQIGRD